MRPRYDQRVVPPILISFPVTTESDGQNPYLDQKAITREFSSPLFRCLFEKKMRKKCIRQSRDAIHPMTSSHFSPRQNKKLYFDQFQGSWSYPDNGSILYAILRQK